MAEQHQHQQTSSTNSAKIPSPHSNLDKLITALANLGITRPDTSSIASITDAISTLSIATESPRDDVYTILHEVNPTSLSSVENAIDLYVLLETFYDQQLDLDKEDPQLDVVRDSLAAQKCWVILNEQRWALVGGKGVQELVGIWGELMRFWMK